MSDPGAHRARRRRRRRRRGKDSRHCQRQVREAREQFLEDDLPLDAGQLAQAEVDAGAEGDVRVGRAADVQPFGARRSGPGRRSPTPASR